MSGEPTETVAFWNCGLAPAGRGDGCADDETYGAAGRTVRSLVQQGARMLGLCEVDEASVRRLRPFLPKSFTLGSCVGRDDRIRWDLALAYDRDAWENRGGSTKIVARYKESAFKAGWRRVLRHRSTGVEVTIFLAHWRSRLHDGRLARERCGEELRRCIEREQRSIIVMGDFNDEPFDKALESLNTSRDIHLVRKNRTLLFNPFWRHLGHEDRHARRCGTYFHRNGDTTRWRTFDQIIISSDFLQDRGLCYEWAGPATQFEDVGDHVPVRLDLHSKEIHHDR